VTHGVNPHANQVGMFDAIGFEPQFAKARRFVQYSRCTFFCFRNGAAFVQSVDFAPAKAQFLEDCLVVLSKYRRTLGRDFRNAMNIDGAANRRGELAAGPFQRNDDVVRA
jgi:hypothetical protein